MSGFHPRDLINEVKARPGIYNKEALEHPRRDHKHQLWLEVAEKLTPEEEWEDFSEVEKEARMDEIQNKWKHLRDHFYREIKLQEAGEANKKRKYIYFDDMEFMRPFVGYKLMPKREKKFSDSLDDSQQFEGNDTYLDMDTLLKTVDKKPAATKRDIKPSHKKLKNKSLIKNFSVLKKTGGTDSPSFKIRDGDISFSLSLVPTLRKMGDAQKLKVKIEILKVLHRYVAHIERRKLVALKNATGISADMADQFDEGVMDQSEDDEEPVDIKHEKQGDPLNGNSKTWWT